MHVDRNSDVASDVSGKAENKNKQKTVSPAQLATPIVHYFNDSNQTGPIKNTLSHNLILTPTVGWDGTGIKF